jgi:short-subunit dehydrogenase
MTKKALVTGASEGIGRVFAEQLAKDGWQITAVARNEARLKELTRDLSGTGASGSQHTYLVADLSDREATSRLADHVAHAGYDLLINNAGHGVYGAFSEMSLEKVHAMMRTNLDALVDLSHAFLSTAKPGDVLLNVASTLALMPFPTAGVYAATKAFVVSFSESLWYENRSRGVHVMALCPGVTATRFHEVAGGTNENRPPKAITQSPEGVVAAALKAIAKRSGPTVLTNATNGMMLFSTRFMSRKAVVKMMGGFAPRDQSSNATSRPLRTNAK